MEHESLGTLLLDFLLYYTEKFTFETSRICMTAPGGSVVAKLPTTDINTFTLSIACLVNPGELIHLIPRFSYYPSGFSNFSTSTNSIDIDIGKPTTKLSHILSAFRDASNRIDRYPFSIQHGNCLGTIIGFPQQVCTRVPFFQRAVYWRQCSDVSLSASRSTRANLRTDHLWII